MALFDLFWRSRTPSAPKTSRKRACCSVELLESRLVPTASVWPYPASLVVPPQPPPSPVGITPSPSNQNPPAPPVTPPVGTSGGYGITWSSTAQDGTGWNVYPR